MKMSDVRRSVREDIVGGRLPLGARVTIDELAGRYGVSHMPIREVLRELHGEGLVVIEPNRGARIRPIDESFVANLFDTRSALEVVLTRRAAQNAASGLVARLWDLELALEAHVAAADYSRVLLTNRAFHQAIYGEAGNPEALAVVDRHWLLVAALWERHGLVPERFAGVTDDHRHLIMAIEEQDAEAAGTMMAAHVLKAKGVLLRRIRANASPELPA